MRYLSVCSGIEAASVAWHPFGWAPVAFAEIDKFPSAVLAHHYPTIPNLGDFTKIEASDVGAIDVLVGGTPCQSFSVAGLRSGLADDRGNLALEFLRLAQRARPKWLVWENVPGVLSSAGGRDFGSILGGLVELRYGFAYRVLDAQFFRVPQRRRRVFLVGHLGDWRRAAAVLFERHSLQGHPAPSRKAGQGVAPTIASRPTGGGGLGTDFDCDGGLVVATARNGHVGSHGRLDFESETFIVPLLASGAHGSNSAGVGAEGDPSMTLDSTGAMAIAFSSKDYGSDALDDCAPTLRAGTHSKSHANAGVPPAVAQPLRSGRMFSTMGNGEANVVPTASAAVRRLTPRECERLQGFPDDYTLIPMSRALRKAVDAEMADYYRRTHQEFSDEDLRRLAADGPRYKALGNSMAVPVMAWIGQRIDLVQAA